MKKALSFIIVYLFSFSGCGLDSCEDIFVFKSVRTARGESVEEIEKLAEKYEREIDKKVEALGKLGIIYQKLGEKYLEKNAWDSAINAFEKAAGSGNHTASLYYSLGAAHANKAKDFPRGHLEQSENSYRKALSIEPDYHEARYGLALLTFYVRGDRREGLTIIQELVLRNKNFYPGRFALGRFHYELDNLQTALSVYEELYSDLSRLAGSPQIDEFRRNCKENIERILRELAGKR